MTYDWYPMLYSGWLMLDQMDDLFWNVPLHLPTLPPNSIRYFWTKLITPAFPWRIYQNSPFHLTILTNATIWFLWLRCPPIANDFSIYSFIFKTLVSAFSSTYVTSTCSKIAEAKTKCTEEKLTWVKVQEWISSSSCTQASANVGAGILSLSGTLKRSPVVRLVYLILQRLADNCRRPYECIWRWEKRRASTVSLFFQVIPSPLCICSSISANRLS